MILMKTSKSFEMLDERQNEQLRCYFIHLHIYLIRVQDLIIAREVGKFNKMSFNIKNETSFIKIFI